MFIRQEIVKKKNVFRFNVQYSVTLNWTFKLY